MMKVAINKTLEAPPSIRKIAALLKMSPMTVSRALSGKSVAEATRALVLKEADKLGYRKELWVNFKTPPVSKKAAVIFYFQEVLDHELLHDYPLYSIFYTKLKTELNALGLTTALVSPEDTGIYPGSVQILVNQVPTEFKKKYPTNDSDLRVIAIDCGETPHFNIQLDLSPYLLAVQKSISRGGACLVVVGDSRSEVIKRRMDYFSEKLSHLPVKIILMDAAVDTHLSDLSRIKTLYLSSPDPINILCMGGWFTLKVWQYLQKEQLEMSEKLNLIGFDNFPFYTDWSIPISRFYLDLDELVQVCLSKIKTDLRVSWNQESTFIPVKFLGAGSFKI